MGFLATKHDLELEYSDDWTQVDLQGKVAGTAVEATLEVTVSGNRKLYLRSADGGIELEQKASAEASKIANTSQVRVPLASNRYFEYKLDGEANDFSVFLVADA